MSPRCHQSLVTTTAALTTRVSLAGLVTVAVLAALPADAGPNGGTVVGGAATIQGQGTGAVTINQSSPSAIINWATFNIGKGEATTFNQPASSSIALNRVVGGNGPSFLDGTLTANGRVFIVNGDGILFGSNSVITTAGFLATTHDIRDQDFMAGNYNFNIAGRPNASIVNLGSITATNAGFAALVAPGVRNSGTITATLGTVSLAAGNAFTLDFYGDRLITLALNDQIAAAVKDVQSGQTLKSLVRNTGTLSANGGRVELTAAAARIVVNSVINNKGVIEANAVGTRSGKIVLSAATGAGKPAGAPAQTVRLAGRISAAGKDKGTTGGTVVVTGEAIVLKGVTIDASGDAGGGKVLIGGDWGGGHPNVALVSNQSAHLEDFTLPTATTVSVDGQTTINASAGASGNGGKVVLWSDSRTTFAGTILAQGGAQAGSGGFVETSSHGQLNFGGAVDARAPNGAAGTLLLDPADYYIVTTLGGSPAGASEMTNAQVQNLLASQNVVIATDNNANPPAQNGDIFVSAPVLWSTATTLTLSAFRNIDLPDINGIDPNIKSTGGGNLVMRADSTGTGVGTINMPGGTNATRVDWTHGGGSVSVYYNPTTFGTQDNLTTGNGRMLASAGQLTQYMLVNNAANLQNINANLAGTYALGRSFGAASFVPFASGTTFTGLLDGNGGLGTISTITGLTLSSSQTTNSMGLFPFIGSAGTVRNLNLAGVTVTAGANIQFIGALAGENDGTVTNVSVTSGTVSGGTFTGIGAGGLVGQNRGSISGSGANVTVSVGDSNNPSQLNFAGGLVGSNLGAIAQSSASGAVSGGANSFVGGLAGQNNFSGSGIGAGQVTITSSFATGAVSITGTSSSAGGLVGQQAAGAVITDSQAFGTVTSTASTPLSQFTAAGGLVGQNQGTVTSTTAPTLASVCAQGAAFSCATGAISVGSHGTGGGLVGFNQGTILKAFATGAVTGASALEGQTNLGGLAGTNQGVVGFSFATGTVGTPGVAQINSGGLVGDNSGTIAFSFATGDARGGDRSQAGGLTGGNSPCGCAGGGDGQNDSASIISSSASGSVTVGAGGIAGGLSGSNDRGTISLSAATGNVSGAGNSTLGGLVGVGAPGAISQSTASGAVASTGPNSFVGGLVGSNAGTISGSSASGPVTGTSDSFLGGFAGVNLGLIQSSATTSSVTGTGSRDIAGGFAGLNFGLVDPSTSSGNVTAGPNSIVGGLVGANAAFSNFSAGTFPGSSFPIGTVSSDSFGTGSANGGPGSTVGAQVGRNYPIAGLPSYPSLFTSGNCGSLCSILSTGILFDPNPQPPTSPPPQPPSQPQVIDNLTGGLTLVSLPSSIDVLPFPAPAAGPRPGPGAQQSVGEPRLIAVPPRGETRFIKDEVVLQVDCDTPQAAIDAVARDLQLTILASQCLTQSHKNLLRMHIDNGRSVADVIRAMARYQIVAVAQANFIYMLMQNLAQDPTPDPDLAGHNQEGDAAQYALGKLGLIDIHRLIKGTNISIAVIDSQIDVKHPDLDGVFAGQYDAVGGAEEQAHPHGTGMAGAIAAHRRLMGIAPAARLYAVHAFSSSAASAESTTFSILKGLDWAASKGVRVINMSFAGPRDPSMERALKSAHDKGIVLIAAAGNAGPKSPPLYPGADPSVIAVTATDANDKVFSGANRGRYIAVAAPGVDILVPAPDNTFQLTTGTSVSSAEVSGIVALLLERNPNLTPEDIRRILTSSAKHPGAKDRDDDLGSGLVDPSKAIQDAGDLKSIQPAKR